MNMSESQNHSWTYHPLKPGLRPAECKTGGSYREGKAPRAELGQGCFMEPGAGPGTWVEVR